MSKRTFTKGFTLVEMVVAIALFIVVALVATGALLKIVDANKRSQSIKTAVTNMNFALESMTRELRVGSDFYCSPGAVPIASISNPSSCSISWTWTIAFITNKKDPTNTCNLIYMYAFNGQSLLKGEQTACNSNAYTLYPVIYGYSAGDANANDAAIHFQTADVKVVTSGGVQPYAQFHFKGYSGMTEKTKSEFDIQTTVSQRLPN